MNRSWYWYHWLILAALIAFLAMGTYGNLVEGWEPNPCDWYGDCGDYP